MQVFILCTDLWTFILALRQRGAARVRAPPDPETGPVSCPACRVLIRIAAERETDSVCWTQLNDESAGAVQAGSWLREVDASGGAAQKPVVDGAVVSAERAPRVQESLSA